MLLWHWVLIFITNMHDIYLAYEFVSKCTALMVLCNSICVLLSMIIVSILNQVLSRSGREEQATMTTLAGLVVVLMMLAQKIAELFDLIRNLFEF